MISVITSKAMKSGKTYVKELVGEVGMIYSGGRYNLLFNKFLQVDLFKIYK